MSDHVPVPGPGEPGRQDHGYAVDPAGRALTLSSTSTASTAGSSTVGSQTVGAPARTPRAPGGPSRRAWRLVGLVTGIVVVASGTAQLVPFLGSSHEERVPLPAGLTSLRIESGSGDVVVQPVASGGSPVVLARVRGWGTPGRLRLDGSTLRAGDLCGPMAVGCDVRLEVAVPAGTALVVDGASGDVSVTDLSGSVEASISSGDIELRGLSGDSVTARTSSGDLRIVDARVRRVTAETSSGDIALSLGSDADLVRATATSGDVHVDVPEGSTAWATTAGTSSGDVRNEIGDAPGATHRIVAETSSGDVQLLRR